MSYTYEDRGPFRGNVYAESNTSRSRSSFHTDNHHNRRPRSPLVPENMPPHPSSSQQTINQPSIQQTFAPKMRNGISPIHAPSLEYGSRLPRTSPLSVPPTGRNGTPNRSFGDRNLQQSGVGFSRGPYTPVSKFFVTVIPPTELTSQADNSSSSRSTSFVSSAHVRRGTLMPLYPTLGAQLYAISREYGLPSIGGLSIYLCDDGEGNLGPRVGEETWPYLWGRYFDENAGELYREITNPTPSPSTIHLQGLSPFSGERERSFSVASAVDPSMDNSIPLKEDEDGDMDPNDVLRFQQSQTQRLQNGLPNSGISPRQFMTPSPMRRSSIRTYNQPQDGSWRASPAPSMMSHTSSKLPIVARIEWAVDKSRAPWWNQFIGVSSNVQDGNHFNRAQTSRNGNHHLQEDQNNSKRHVPGQRSMHLTKSLRDPIESHSESADSQAYTEPRAATFGGDPNGLSSYDTIASDEQTHSNNSLPISRSAEGYAPLDDDEEEEEEMTNTEVNQEDIDDNLPIGEDSFDTEENGVTSQDGQSYAGFSALMGVVNGTGDHAEARSTQDNGMYKGEDNDVITEERSSLSGDEAAPAFNPNALEDDEMWNDMQAERTNRTSSIGKGIQGFDTLSASKLSHLNQRFSPNHTPQISQSRGSAVHEWIVKTHSPPVQLQHPKSAGSEDEDVFDDEEEEDAQEPQDDVADVIGLWAAKASDPTGNVPILPLVDRSITENARRSMTEKSVSSRSVQMKDRRSMVSSASSSAVKSHSRQISRAASHTSRQSRHSSKRDRASQSHLVSTDLADVENNTLLRADGSDPNAVNPASLLSPIALQENDGGMFGGPAPDLRGLLPPQTPDAMKQGHQDREDEGKLVSEELNNRILHNKQTNLLINQPIINSPTLLSPRQLDIPNVLRSPGQMSGSSSTSDMSDTLMDMERALALLSPSGFGQQRSPLVTKVNDQLQTGEIPNRRMRFTSNVSASESMARARSLSASVTASPKWFRSPNAEDVPAMPRIISPSEASNMAEKQDDLEESSNENTLASRPKSLSAATQKALYRIQTKDVEELSALPSANQVTAQEDDPMPAITEEVKPTQYDSILLPEPSKEDSPVAIMDDHDLTTIPSSKNVVQRDVIADVVDGHEVEQQKDFNGDLEESYDPDTKDYAMRDEWIDEQRKNISPKTDDIALLEDDGNMIKNESQPNTVSPKYATIGVQAEMEDSVQTSSQFSLMSGDGEDDGEERSTSYGRESDEEDEMHDLVRQPLLINHDQTNLEHEELHNESHERISSTSQEATYDEVKEQKDSLNEQSKSLEGPDVNNTEDPNEYQQSSLARIVRDSMSEGIEDTIPPSKAVSTDMMSSEEELTQLPWLETRDQNEIREPIHRIFHHEVHVQSEAEAGSPPQDDMTTTRGGNSTNRNSTLSEDQWSQEDSASEGEHTQQLRELTNEEGENIDGILLNRGKDESNALARLSNLSGISSHREVLESSGGRTPTFLYDQHLTEIDHLSGGESRLSNQFGQTLSPIHAEHGLLTKIATTEGENENVNPTLNSGTSTYSSQNTFIDSTDQRSSADGLGIKMVNPTPRLPLASVQGLISRHGIVSLAGEPVELDGERMPNGFEEVFVQSPTRSAASTAARSGTTENNDKVSQSGIATMLNGQDLDQQSNGNFKDERPLRRSMGSISDRNRDQLQSRRASASAASATNGGVSISSKRPSPRLTVQDGRSIPIRRSMSPLSPRHRFAALPPSPSLQGNTKLIRTTNNQIPHSTSVPSVYYGKVNSNGSPTEFEPPQPAFSARSSSFGSSTVSPTNLKARNGVRQSNSASNSPRIRGSPLVIDTVKAQLGQWKKIIVSPVKDQNQSSVDGIMLSNPNNWTMSPQQSNTSAPFRGQAANVQHNTTPPSPRGPRAQPSSNVPSPINFQQSPVIFSP